MDKNIKFRLLCKLWEDPYITPEEMEEMLEARIITPDDMLIWATMNGLDQLVNVLLLEGANPDKRGRNDRVPALFRAVEAYKGGSTFSSVSLLMKAGASPHHFMEWYDMRTYQWHYGTVAVVAFKAFGINILKAAA